VQFGQPGPGPLAVLDDRPLGHAEDEPLGRDPVAPEGLDHQVDERTVGELGGREREPEPQPGAVTGAGRPPLELGAGGVQQPGGERAGGPAAVGQGLEVLRAQQPRSGCGQQARAVPSRTRPEPRLTTGR
jgi:hypothetical protein